jgi:hypothetical protein
MGLVCRESSANMTCSNLYDITATLGVEALEEDFDMYGSEHGL